MNLSEKISIIRKARRFTQEELGDRIGVSRQTVSDWEKGKFEPTLDSIRAIAHVLNVSYDVLLNDMYDLNDEKELSIALKNLDNATKGKINNSFRYHIRQYTVTKKDYNYVIIYFSLMALFIIGALLNFILRDTYESWFIVESALCSVVLTLILLLSLPIQKIQYIKKGGYRSFGTLSQTHFVIIGWSDSKFDRTIYIPVTEIEKMELDRNATKKHGKVIVTIKGRTKPLITNEIVEPCTLIGVFNNLETFIDNSYEK